MIWSYWEAYNDTHQIEWEKQHKLFMSYIQMFREEITHELIWRGRQGVELG